jgi:GNAT superfamily N-acetyltransferase
MTAAKPVVRPATIDDVTEISAAYLTAWRAAYADLLDPSVLEEQAEIRAKHDWEGAIASEDMAVAVAVDGDEIVGVVEFDDPWAVSAKAPMIEMLYVVPAAWGTGAATQLLTLATDRMRGCGHPFGRLRVVEAQARARRFYEREGWRLEAETPPATNGFYALLSYRRDLTSGDR